MQQLTYQELDSTNSEAVRLIESGSLKEGVITASVQTAGRGQKNNTWYSESPEGLYFSCFQPYEMDLDLEKKLFFSKLALEGVQKIIVDVSSVDATIKYPNDIWIDDKKVAGILTEFITHQSQNYVIVGVGINLNQTEFPIGLKNPVSLYQLTKTRFSKELFILKLTELFETILVSPSLNLGYVSVLKNSI